MGIDKQEILNLIGTFSWGWNHLFFVETPEGNFVYSSSEYPEGDDTLVKYSKDLSAWLKEQQIPFVRSKGSHVIKNFCGEDVEVLF